MNVRLTYTLIAFLALSLLASCSAEKSDEPTAGVALEFTVGADSRASRSDNPVISEFAVFGDMKGIGSSDPAIKVFENVPVTYNTTESRWEYSGTQFWFTFHEYSFAAVSPRNAISDVDYSGSQLSFTYTLPSDHSRIVDLLAATHRRKYFDGPADVVRLQFSHIMAQLNLAAAFNDNGMTENDYISFHKLELTGFKPKASFKLRPSALQSNNQTNDAEIEVNGIDGEGKLTVEMESPVKVRNNGQHVKLFTENESIIMLPQTFAADSDAEFILTYTIGDDTSQMKQVALPLKNLVWATGKSYTYRFTINRTSVVIDNTIISEWETVNGGNFDIK